MWLFLFQFPFFLLFFSLSLSLSFSFFLRLCQRNGFGIFPAFYVLKEGFRVTLFTLLNRHLYARRFISFFFLSFMHSFDFLFVFLVRENLFISVNQTAIILILFIFYDLMCTFHFRFWCMSLISFTYSKEKKLFILYCF